MTNGFGRGATGEEAERMSLDGIWQPERREAATHRGLRRVRRRHRKSSDAAEPATKMAAPAVPEVG